MSDLVTLLSQNTTQRGPISEAVLADVEMA